jgi:hypothetical protein
MMKGSVICVNLCLCTTYSLPQDFHCLHACPSACCFVKMTGYCGASSDTAVFPDTAAFFKAVA